MLMIRACSLKAIAWGLGLVGLTRIGFNIGAERVANKQQTKSRGA